MLFSSLWRVMGMGMLGLGWIAAVEAAEVSLPAPFAAGETLKYDIKQLGLTVGEAALVFEGETTSDARTLYLIRFTAKSFRFSDEEQIYLDPATFLPVRIERNLDIFGKKENIVEYYNAIEGSVRVVKTSKGKTTEQTLHRGHPVENIYGFIYRYRRSGKFAAGENIQIHLPTRDILFKLIGQDMFKTSDKQIPAFLLQSEPPKYKVWFDSGTARIPLRIDGVIGISKTVLVIQQDELLRALRH